MENNKQLPSLTEEQLEKINGGMIKAYTDKKGKQHIGCYKGGKLVFSIPVDTGNKELNHDLFQMLLENELKS